MKTKRVKANIIPAILAMIKFHRATGLERRSSTVPLLISRETALLEQKTAAIKPKSSVVAIELSTTSFSCSRKTNREMEGKSPIKIIAPRKRRKNIGSLRHSLKVFRAI